jgi:hypothetical protein
MNEIERHFYDKYAKYCLDALPNFVYDRLETGMAAKAGADGSAEWADVWSNSQKPMGF